MTNRTIIGLLWMLGATLLVAPGAGAAGGPWSHLMQMPSREAPVRLDQPVGLSVDTESGRYYVVDAAGGQLVSFDRGGQYLAAFNAGGEIEAPMAMARTSRGKFWVTERSSNVLLYVDPRQKETRRFTLRYPDGGAVLADRLALDGRDRLFVLDRARGSILRLDDDLKVAEAIGSGLCDFKIVPGGIWALDGLERTVYHFAQGSPRPAPVRLEGELQFPSALEVDPSGQLLYILDRHSGKIAVFDRQGAFKYDFLGKGRRRGQLASPGDLLFDGQGRLCVVDEGNRKVEVYAR